MTSRPATREPIDAMLNGKGSWGGSHRQNTEAAGLVNSFLVRLELTDLPSADGRAAERHQLEAASTRFILNVLMSIEYYNKRIFNARIKRSIFLVVFSFLIVAIPIAMALLSNKQLGSDAGMITALVVGALTALTGLQKVLTAWAGVYQRFVFWRSTVAKLRKEWYSIDTNWLKKSLKEAEDVEKFCIALNEASMVAADAIDQEQDDYYRSLSAVDLDVVGTVSGALTSAKALVGNVLDAKTSFALDAADATSRATNRAAARTDVARKQAILDGLNGKRNEKRAALAAEQDSTTKSNINAEIATLTTAIATAEVALNAAKVELTVQLA